MILHVILDERACILLENVAQLPYASRINKLVHVQTDTMGQISLYM